VHCAAGRSRSAAMVVGYLMYKDKLTFAEAFTCVNDIRRLCLNLAFETQLQEFEKNNYVLQ